MEMEIKPLFANTPHEIASDGMGFKDKGGEPQLTTRWHGSSYELVSAKGGWQIKSNGTVVSGIYRFESSPRRIDVGDRNGDGKPDLVVTLKNRKVQQIDGLDENDPLYGSGLETGDEPHKVKPPEPQAKSRPESAVAAAKALRDAEEFLSNPANADIVDAIGTREGCAKGQMKLADSDVCAFFSRKQLERAAKELRQGHDVTLTPEKYVYEGDTVVGERERQSTLSDDELDRLIAGQTKPDQTKPATALPDAGLNRKPRVSIARPDRGEEEGVIAPPYPDRPTFDCDDKRSDPQKWAECIEDKQKKRREMIDRLLARFGNELRCPTTPGDVEAIKDITGGGRETSSRLQSVKSLLGFQPIASIPASDTQVQLPTMCEYDELTGTYTQGMNGYLQSANVFVQNSWVDPRVYPPQFQPFLQAMGIQQRTAHTIAYTMSYDQNRNRYRYAARSDNLHFVEVYRWGVQGEDPSNLSWDIGPRGEKVRSIPKIYSPNFMRDPHINLYQISDDFFVYERFSRYLYPRISGVDNDRYASQYGIIVVPRPERLLALACRESQWFEKNKDTLPEGTATDIGNEVAVLRAKAKFLKELTAISRLLSDPTRPEAMTHLEERARQLNAYLAAPVKDFVKKYRDQIPSFNTSACQQMLDESGKP